MNLSRSDYAIVKPVSSSYEETIDKVRAALKEEGFGILSEIDIAATLKAKLDVDTPRTLVLGACNPKLANRALSAEVNISTLLPCNVVVRENGKGQTEVAAVNPWIMGRIIGSDPIRAVADEADQKIRRALATLD